MKYSQGLRTFLSFILVNSGWTSVALVQFGELASLDTDVTSDPVLSSALGDDVLFNTSSSLYTEPKIKWDLSNSTEDIDSGKRFPNHVQISVFN